MKRYPNTSNVSLTKVARPNKHSETQILSKKIDEREITTVVIKLKNNENISNNNGDNNDNNNEKNININKNDNSNNSKIISSLEACAKFLKIFLHLFLSIR